MARHASNPFGAAALLDWLSTEAGQKLLAGDHMEYPVNPRVPADPSMAAWHELAISAAQLAGAAYYYEEAVLLMERAGYRALL